MLWNFYWFRGCPRGSGGWVDWCGGGYGCVGVSHACTHAHACCKHDKHGCLHGGSHLQFLYMYTYLCVRVHSYACMHMHVVNMINMDASMGAAVCNFYTCIHICVRVHSCACMHMDVHMCGDIPMLPDIPPSTCPLPRAAGSPKHQNSISLRLIEIFQFSLKILYL